MSVSPPPRHSPLQGRTIMLIEDEGLIVLDVKRALEREGARVIDAASAERGLELLGTFRPDAAILDLKLGREGNSEPVVDRLDALGIPYLLHTGDTLRHGALLARLDVPILSKPYPSHHLVERIAELLDDRHRADR